MSYQIKKPLVLEDQGGFGWIFCRRQHEHVADTVDIPPHFYLSHL
jgi:hypothetical protein